VVVGRKSEKKKMGFVSGEAGVSQRRHLPSGTVPAKNSKKGKKPDGFRTSPGGSGAKTCKIPAAANKGHNANEGGPLPSFFLHYFKKPGNIYFLNTKNRGIICP